MPKKKQNAKFSFDFSSLKFAGQNAEDDREEIPKLSTEPAAFGNAENMVKSMDYTKDYFCLVPGNFIFGDFIEALCYRKQLKPTVIYMTTLGMSRENVDSIVNLVDYLGCKKVNLIVSNYFNGVERHGIMPYIRQEFAGKPVDVAVLQSHCKIVLIRSNKGNVLLSGSANLSSSNNVEQFVVMHDETALNYVQKRLDTIMSKFTVFHGMENRAIPVKGNKNTGKYAFEEMIKE